MNLRIFLNEYIIESEKTNLHINFTSGKAINITIFLQDILNQTLIFDNLSRAIFTDADLAKHENFKIFGNEAVAVSGIFYFPSLTIHARPLKKFSMKLRVFLKKIVQEMDFEEKKELKLYFFSEKCKIGDIYMQSDQTCKPCPEGTYSLTDPMSIDPNLQSCKACPQYANCPGGSKIIPIQGYWRSSENSTLIIECYAKVSCLGGFQENTNRKDSVCEKNSFGTLCHYCRLDSLDLTREMFVSLANQKLSHISKYL